MGKGPEGAPARRHLTPNEKTELQAAWPAVVCAHCGRAHPGTCTRVREMTTTRAPNGAISTHVVYWPNDRWVPPVDSLGAEDVFGSAVPVPPTVEATAVEVTPTKAKKAKGG